MNPELRASRLDAAIAAARHLLIHAIDLRFDLDEAGDTGGASLHRITDSLHCIRSVTATLEREIQGLAALLSSEAPLVKTRCGEDVTCGTR